MNAPKSGPPTRILMATDLSARCDRALDRAVSLAGEWQAHLTILHVLEEFADPAEHLPSWRRPPDPLAVARKQLLLDIGDAAQTATVAIEQGDAATAIVRVAEREGSGLIVTGIAREELFGRFNLGSTVDRLVRRSLVPLLIVKSRARRPYGRVLVATDFSDSSRHALEAAARLFPQQELILFHAYQPAAAGPIVDPGDAGRAAAEREAEAFLRGSAVGGARPRLLIERGEPAALLRDYLREHEVDLVALGSHGRSAALEIFLGSVAREIMEEVSCDVLVVRDPRAATER